MCMIYMYNKSTSFLHDLHPIDHKINIQTQMVPRAPGVWLMVSVQSFGQ